MYEITLYFCKSTWIICYIMTKQFKTRQNWARSSVPFHYRSSQGHLFFFRCCHKHDCCYGDAEFAGCQTKMDRYHWTCKEEEVDCGMMCYLDIKLAYWYSFRITLYIIIAWGQNKKQKKSINLKRESELVEKYDYERFVWPFPSASGSSSNTGCVL